MRRSRSFLSFVLVSIIGSGAVAAAPFADKDVCVSPWFFSLSATDYSDRGTEILFLETLIDGQVVVQQSDPNMMVLQLSVERMRLVGDHPLPSDRREMFVQFVRCIPFTSRVSLSPTGEGPIRMQLVRGAADPNDTSGTGRQDLQSQYAIVYLILDMMMLTDRQTEKVAAGGGCERIVTAAECSKVITDRLGPLGPSDLRSFVHPSQFCVVPIIEGKRIQGLRFTSFHCYGRDVKYYSRTLDQKSNRVVHAVSLEAFAKEKIDEGVFKMNDVLNDLTRFRQYQLYELSISDEPF